MTDDLVKRLQWSAFKFCGKGEQENLASDAMSEASNRIEQLEYALRSIADTPIGKEIPDRTTAWGLAFHMQQTAKDALKEGKHEQR
jgi:hypothetical protein